VTPGTELTYPSFPKRTLVTIAIAVIAFAGVAIALNRSGPDMHGCAAAAARVMAARNYSLAGLQAQGPGRIDACHGLSASQFGQAIADAYQIEYGDRLPNVSITTDLPPPSYRASSAQQAARAR